MEFIIERISVQGGGLLMPMPPETFASEPQHLSFQWMERVSEEKPWYRTLNPNTSWRDDPITLDEDFVTHYESEMAECLQHDDEASKVKALKDVVNELKIALHQLTRNGNPLGMRHAYETLRMQPVPIALAALHKAVPHSRNIHLLDLVSHYLGEIAHQYLGEPADQGIFTSPTVIEASERLGLNLEADFHTQLGSLFVAVLRALHDAKEYRHVRKSVFLCSNDQILELIPVENVLSSLSALGDFASYIPVVEDLGQLDGLRILSKEFLTATCDDIPPFECKFNAQYDPEKSLAAGGSQDCAECRRTCLVTYWCAICEEVPYCCSACADRHWENGHKLVCCSKDGKHVGLCAYCSKRAILGCPYCKFTYYCSSDCQENHWYGGHKDTCPKEPMASPPDSA